MAARRALHVALIPGDGIGKEVIPAAQRVLEALTTSTPLTFSFTTLPAGFATFRETGAALPPRTLDTLRSECNAALFGAVSSPTTPTPGYSSPIVALRKKLDLYANVRPVRSVRSSDSTAANRDVDLVIVRENTEDLYVKKEHTFDTPGGQVAFAVKQISTSASSRIARMAGDIAQRRSAITKRTPHVTISHKSNVLPETDGLFRRVAREVLLAPPYQLDTATSNPSTTSVSVSEQIIDSLFYKLYLDPSQYDVIVAPNLYGDLLSDAAAALVGSLGLVPSANVGDNFVVGEPCHGSAPDIEGKSVANPIAAIRSAALMLESLGELDAAHRIDMAVDKCLAEGRMRTPDLGGTCTTDDVLEDVLRRL